MHLEIKVSNGLSENGDAEDTAYNKGYEAGYNDASKDTKDEASGMLLSEYESGYNKGYETALNEAIKNC